MTFRTVIDALTEQSDALRVAVEAKKETLDAAEAVAVASAAVVVGKQPGAEANAATAASKATEATNNATQIAAYKTAAAALDTSTTATAAVTNLLPDMLAKKDPARHPFRKKMPTLVLDFERQKCHRYAPGSGFGETALSSFMTFARNSTATYTGPDGLIKTAAANEARYDYDPLTGECKGLLIEESRTNFVSYSSSPRVWSKFGGATEQPYYGVSPDGVLNATRIRLNKNDSTYTGVVKSFAGLSVGDVACVSIYIKVLSGTGVLNFSLEGGAFGSTGQSLSLSLSTMTITSGGGLLTYDITPYLNGWYRVTYTRKVTLTANCNIAIACGSLNNFDFLISDFQLEAGEFPTSYIPSTDTWTARASTATYVDSTGTMQTAASGVARSAAYDYDSDGVLRPIGLLLESAATNLLTYSEQFDNAVWTKYESSITANATTAPDGNVTADKIVENTNSNFHYISQTVPCNASTTYTMHARLKQGGRAWCRFRITTSSGTSFLVFYDLVNGVYSSSTIFGAITPLIKKSANGFYNCSATFTTGSSDTSITSRIDVASDDGVVSYAGDGTSGIYIWGAQLEAGNYATSYIQTTSAQVTRVADSSTSAQTTRVADDAKVYGTKFSDFYNQSQGTLVATQRIGTATGVNDSSAYRRGVACLDIDTNAQMVRLCAAGKDVVVKSVDAQFDESIGTITANSTTRQAVRLSKANFIGAHDGTLGAAHNAGSTPSVSVLRIGKSDPTNGYLNGHVARISYYPQPFTNEELQAATSA